jgi:hypothetical protein
MKTLICTALVVLSVSVCVAQTIPTPADPLPPSVPGIPDSPPGGTPELPGGPGTIPERKTVPPVPGGASQDHPGPNPKGNKVEQIDPPPTIPTVPGKKVE